MRRYTTILLTTQRLNSRDRAVLAIVVVCLTLFAAGLAIGMRPAAAPQLAPRLTTYVFIIATPSPRPEPTPEPVVIFQTVEVPIDRPVYVEVQAAPRAEPPPEPTATPLPPLVVGETLAEYFARTGITPETVR